VGKGGSSGGGLVFDNLFNPVGVNLAAARRVFDQVNQFVKVIILFLCLNQGLEHAALGKSDALICGFSALGSAKG
jgi:hypothetical protein